MKNAVFVLPHPLLHTLNYAPEKFSVGSHGQEMYLYNYFL